MTEQPSVPTGTAHPTRSDGAARPIRDDRTAPSLAAADTPLRPAADAPLRIAVVGAGPKALYALEKLTALLDAAGSATATADDAGAARSESSAASGLTVTVIDPVAVPGTGAAYHPGQPHHLRLNVTAAILDEPATGDFPAYPSWVQGPYPQLADEPYPPRAVVGEYLAQRWQQMIHGLSRHARVEHARARVTDLRREGSAWHLTTDTAPADLGPVDEVLIATGHAAGHRGALVHHWSSPLPLVPAVLPAQRMLSAAHVPRGSRVAVRGGALTFIDACLTLTEGRGGTFTESTDVDATGGTEADAPSRLVHHRGPHEPDLIRPITRQGLLLDAKPDPGTPLTEAGERAVEQARARFTSDQGMGPDAVLAIVVDAATAMLEGTPAPKQHATASGRDARDTVVDSRAAVEHTLSTGAEPDLPRGPGRAEAALRRSIETAQGHRSPGPAWALGRVWQTLYSPISAALRGSDAPEEEWARFRQAAQALERFAFGPPLVNARKLLAMIDSGAVDLSWMDADVSIDAHGIHEAPVADSSDATAVGRHDDAPSGGDVDVVIDAVLTPPGLLNLTDELAGSLLRRGLVQVRPGRRGAMIDEAGSPVGRDDAPLVAADGRAVDGLALIGRPTEDHVIGHDSLNRHLHHEGRCWARRIAERITGADDPAPAVTAAPGVAASPAVPADGSAPAIPAEGSAPAAPAPAVAPE
ncbi:FAD/NAD(P)-binding protein [Brachybacterium muris]|uniref:Amino acid decarboxylase n=1 Tax=Brachybacterium muris UCD-AY4 TaxID=1249481 RepID=A0A022KSX5_9MICO|nr:FAD/NAD(P)-binding protein [Brachybacterium muris]EYT48837.1 amino acid decarboxylase [Brachybacterium muris UCD-AY4]